MIPSDVYAAALAFVQDAGLLYTDDMGATSSVQIVESDTVPTDPPNGGAVLAWSMFPIATRPLENPRAAAWRATGYVQMHVMVPANVGPRGRMLLVNAVSDIYRAATPNSLGVIYGFQTSSAPTDDDAGVYSVTTLQVAWECDEPMPTPSGDTTQ